MSKLKECKNRISLMASLAVMIFLATMYFLNLASRDAYAKITNICCQGSGSAKAVIYFGDSDFIETYATVRFSCIDNGGQPCQFLVSCTSSFSPSDPRNSTHSDQDISINLDCNTANISQSVVSGTTTIYQPVKPGTYQMSVLLYSRDCNDATTLSHIGGDHARIDIADNTLGP